MPKMKKTALVLLAVLVMIALAGTAALAKKDGGKSNSSERKAKSEKADKLNDFEKPSGNSTNATVHRKEIKEVASGLLKAAEQEKKQEEQAVQTEEPGDGTGSGEKIRVKTKTREEVVADLERIAGETTASETEIVAAMEQVESRNRFKSLLFGSDFKNLGQLRSSLVHNRNQIRKLTVLLGSTTDEAAKATIQEQLLKLTQGQERIQVVVAKGEEGFSLLGWAFRFLNDYYPDPVGEVEEAELEEDVAEALKDEPEDEGDVSAEDAGLTEEAAGEGTPSPAE